MSLIVAGRWTKIDPVKEQHLGHIYEKDGKRAHDKRCDYCGKWMCYDVRDIAAWGDNVKIGLNGWPEKVHCGSDHCIEYHSRTLRHEEKLKNIVKRETDRMFFKMKKMGVIQ